MPGLPILKHPAKLIHLKMIRIKNGVVEKLVFCKYKTVKDRRIYPKRAKVFAFWVRVDKQWQEAA